MPDMGMVMVGLVVLAIFWVRQFVQLMLLGDDCFPGRFDKVIWAGAFVLIWPCAPFAFWMWKGARVAESGARGAVKG